MLDSRKTNKTLPGPLSLQTFLILSFSIPPSGSHKADFPLALRIMTKEEVLPFSYICAFRVLKEKFVTVPFFAASLFSCLQKRMQCSGGLFLPPSGGFTDLLTSRHW